MKLVSHHRDPGVHAVTVECDAVCGNTFIFHSDSDLVICPNCGRRGLWRHSHWSDQNPDLIEGVDPIGGFSRSAKGEDHGSS